MFFDLIYLNIVQYAEFKATIDIQNLKISTGELPGELKSWFSTGLNYIKMNC